VQRHLRESVEPQQAFKSSCEWEGRDQESARRGFPLSLHRCASECFSGSCSVTARLVRDSCRFSHISSSSSPSFPVSPPSHLSIPSSSPQGSWGRSDSAEGIQERLRTLCTPPQVPPGQAKRGWLTFPFSSLLRRLPKDEAEGGELGQTEYVPSFSLERDESVD
jgi:hypothetical protein